MKSLSGLGLLSFLLLVGAVFGIVLLADVTLNTHNFVGRCEMCHLTMPKDGEAGRFTRQISYLCRECHSLNEQNSHPIGVRPSMQVPEEFPLDWNGRLTCATCHDPHNGENLYLRTRARGREFCETCHLGFLPMEGKHAGVSGIAHTKPGVQPDLSRYSEILDSVSLECLNCHDGVIASDASYQLDGGEALTYQQLGVSHPVGMDYRQAAMNDPELKPIESISPLINFYDGKVGCASCHNPYSRERRMLVVSNWGSALCLECHVK